MIWTKAKELAREVLGDERARRFHVHFSRIEFSAGGEKRHWTFAETQFGPEPQPLMELLAERRLEPVIICESAGTQAEDAQAMQRMYEAATGVTSQALRASSPKGRAFNGSIPHFLSFSSLFYRNPLPNGAGLGKINRDMRNASETLN